MISDEQLAAWERLANEAAEGPWYRCLLTVCQSNLEDCTTYNHQCRNYAVNECDKRNVEFMAASRAAVPALIAELRGLRKTLHAVSDTSNKLLEDNNQLCSQNGRLQSEHLEMGLEVGRLKMKVAQLEKEADWLAKELGNSHCHISTIGPDCPDYHDGDSKNCHKCWREAARKGVAHD